MPSNGKYNDIYLYDVNKKGYPRGHTGLSNSLINLVTGGPIFPRRSASQPVLARPPQQLQVVQAAQPKPVEVSKPAKKENSKKDESKKDSKKDGNESDDPEEPNIKDYKFESEQDLLLLRLKAEGKTWLEISKMMRLPRGLLYTHYLEVRKKLETDPTAGPFIWQPEQDGMLRRLRIEEKKSWQEISDKMKISKRLLHQRFWELADRDGPSNPPKKPEQANTTGNQQPSDNKSNHEQKSNNNTQVKIDMVLPVFESATDRQIWEMKTQNKSWNEICNAMSMKRQEVTARWRELQKTHGDRSNNAANSKSKESNKSEEQGKENKKKEEEQQNNASWGWGGGDDKNDVNNTNEAKPADNKTTDNKTGGGNGNDWADNLPPADNASNVGWGGESVKPSSPVKQTNKTDSGWDNKPSSPVKETHNNNNDGWGTPVRPSSPVANMSGGWGGEEATENKDKAWGWSTPGKERDKANANTGWDNNPWKTKETKENNNNKTSQDNGNLRFLSRQKLYEQLQESLKLEEELLRRAREAGFVREWKMNEGERRDDNNEKEKLKNIEEKDKKAESKERGRPHSRSSRRNRSYDRRRPKDPSPGMFPKPHSTTIPPPAFGFPHGYANPYPYVSAPYTFAFPPQGCGPYQYGMPPHPYQYGVPAMPNYGATMPPPMMGYGFGQHGNGNGNAGTAAPSGGRWVFDGVGGGNGGRQGGNGQTNGSGGWRWEY
jgi:hypothetical protein